MIERKEGKVEAPVACKTCAHTPIVRVIEWVKCKKCDRLFGRTKTGKAWKMERALHMARRHGAKLDKELEKI